MQQPQRIQILDVLRAIAIFMVLGHHTLGINEAVTGYHWWLVLKIRQVGWAGVDLFFVLSGFLIGGLLCKEYISTGQLRPWRFLARRAFKIYPPFYCLLALTWIWMAWNDQLPELHAWLGELVFLQNYVGRVWKQTWSLAVEEHYYLLIALLFWWGATTRILSRSILVVIAVTFLLVGVLAHRLWLTQVGTDFDRETQVFPTHLRIDALLFGTLLSYAWNFHQSKTKSFIRYFRWPLLLIATSALLPLWLCPLEHWYMRSFGFSTNYLGFGAVLMLGVGNTFHVDLPSNKQILRLLAAVGRQSYSIYLWHMALFHAVNVVLPLTLTFESRFFLHGVLYIFLSVLVGALMSRLVEIPSLWLRDRWIPPQTQAKVG